MQNRIMTFIFSQLLLCFRLSSMDVLSDGTNTQDHLKDQWEETGDFSKFYDSGGDLNRLFYVTSKLNTSIVKQIWVGGYVDGSMKLQVTLRENNPGREIVQKLVEKELVDTNYLLMPKIETTYCFEEKLFSEFLSVFVGMEFLSQYARMLVLNKINTEIPAWDINDTQFRHPDPWW